MKKFVRCLWLNQREFIRTRKNILSLLAIISCCAFMILSTLLIPKMLDKATGISSYLKNGESASVITEKLFPQDMKGSCGVFASDIVLFYSLMVILTTYTLLPNEIKNGRIIPPICAGYSKAILLISKEVVYGLFFAIPVFCGYLLYYSIAGKFLIVNYPLREALQNAAALSIAEFCIAAFSIVLSLINKQPMMTFALMASCVMIIPDALSYFQFARFFPTYLLTYTYNSSKDFCSFLWPVWMSMLVLCLTNIFALRKRMEICYDSRR